MNITPCKSCNSKWPYLFVLFLSTFISLLTWLTLATEEHSTTFMVTSTVGAFFVAFVLLSAYIITCVRQQCEIERGYTKIDPEDPAYSTRPCTPTTQFIFRCK
ncbi:MAG: hypothetical protein BECKG1743D_GA0114223_105824 [Candidatus Kentron sp. G]|nr:MAG: hypothetical protein BECKG1743D_GA0114223_105824 [Candidatus Kentron sp. G]VFN06406.1 MAG: hypothetical protein BECKG1743F_GA0114225_112271 [Candidatus Kentron sp. G]VFN07359.1 MAG: hypothetical protein BECKG1743E_GA0114224_111921 [Candidatus Kentron sp. G]